MSATVHTEKEPASGHGSPPLFALSMRSELQLLPVVRLALEEVCRLANFDASRAHEFTLAVYEACANVILHAHQKQADRVYRVEVCMTSDGVEASIHDQGTPFDFQAVPDLDPTQPRRGGRGVYLIRRLVDRVTAESSPAGNVLRLFKRTAAEDAMKEAP